MRREQPKERLGRGRAHVRVVTKGVLESAWRGERRRHACAARRREHLEGGAQAESERARRALGERTAIVAAHAEIVGRRIAQLASCAASLGAVACELNVAHRACELNVAHRAAFEVRRQLEVRQLGVRQLGVCQLGVRQLEARLDAALVQSLLRVRAAEPLERRARQEGRRVEGARQPAAPKACFEGNGRFGPLSGAFIAALDGGAFSAALDGGAQRGPEPLAPRLEVGLQVLVVVSEPELMHRRRAQLE